MAKSVSFSIVITGSCHELQSRLHYRRRRHCVKEAHICYMLHIALRRYALPLTTDDTFLYLSPRRGLVAWARSFWPISCRRQAYL